MPRPPKTKSPTNNMESPDESPKNDIKRSSAPPVPTTPKKKYRAKSESISKPKTKGGNTIVTFESKVDEVLLHVFTKNSGNEGSYTYEMIMDWEDDANRRDEWGIHEWLERKQAGTDNSPMYVKPVDSDYAWKVAVTYKFYLEEDATPQSVGTNIANKFTQFAKEHPKVSHMVLILVCILF